jgi:hypothetical protein
MRAMSRFLVGTLVVLAGCSGNMNNDGGTGGGRGGGSGGGGGTALTPFALSALDDTAADATYFAMAVDPVLERVGVAYFTPRGTETVMGQPDFDIKYVEWKQGALVGPPETLRFVQRKVGIALAFDPTNGEPVVAYLGGAAGFVQGMSIFWFQSDAVINRRTNGVWTETVIATTGDQVTCGNVVSDRGLLVGLWPALAFDSTGKLYFGYRDGHDGQFPQQDWGGSDVEVWSGTTTPSMGACVAEGGNNKNAYGGHLQMIMGPNNQPAVVHDQMFGTADSNGTNVVFQLKGATTWPMPGGTLLNISNTQTGPALAWDAMEGFGIAVVDRSASQLTYVNSLNGAAWSNPDPVFGAGSGGWYPSLAMDPINHEPSIAFYICSPRNGIAETSCLTTEDELRVTQRIAGTWRETVVDPEGGFAPKIGFFASGKRVVVYRLPPSVDPTTGLTSTKVGKLKIAVER